MSGKLKEAVDKKEEEIIKAITVESDRIANWLNKIEDGTRELRIGQLLLNIMMKCDIGYYESIGILEDVKLEFREIILSPAEDEDKEVAQ